MDVEKANAIIGANLRAQRAKKNYSRKQLVELSGVPLITLRRIEDGERAALVPTLIELCRALGVDVAEFLDVVQQELDQLQKLGSADAGE